MNSGNTAHEIPTTSVWSQRDVTCPAPASILDAGNWSVSREVTRLLGWCLVLLLATQRLAIPAGSFAIPFAAPIVFGLFGWGLCQGYLQIDCRRLMAFAAAMSLLTVSSLAVNRSHTISYASLLFLAGIYSFLVVIAPRCELKSFFRSHQSIMLGFCIVGIGQFVVQLLGAPFIDPLAGVPEVFMLPGYNTIQPLYFDATVIKPNAGLFLEASHLSKAIAVAILIELIYFRRGRYFAIYCACYAFTFSGTGLITLAIGVLTGLRYIPFKSLVVFGVLCVCAAVVVGAAGYGDVWLDRTAEFGTVNSSGRSRFIEPYLRLSTVLRDDFAFFGQGAGSVQETFSNVGGVDAFDPAPVKLFYEYGPLSACAFMGFMLFSLYTGSAPRPLQHAGAVVLFFLIGGMLEATSLYYVFLISGIAVDSQPVHSTTDRFIEGLPPSASLQSVLARTQEVADV